MFDNLGSQIDVQFRPVIMTGVWFLNIKYLRNSDILEPGKVVVGQEQLHPGRKKPYSVTGNICYFNRGSAFSKRF